MKTSRKEGATESAEPWAKALSEWEGEGLNLVLPSENPVGMGEGGNVLVVMAKYPQAGAVKTRLAEDIGAEAACDLYGAFLADIARRMDGGAWSCVWAVWPAGSRLDRVVGAGARHLDQRGDGLAERMYACFVDLFAGGADRVVMIGGDAPNLDRDCIKKAFDALEDSPVVLVPSRDGGYCLVGLDAPRDIFSGVAMSTNRVLTETVDRCAALGLGVCALPERYDVDDIEDVRRLEDEIIGGADLPATAKVLAGWRRLGRWKR